MKNTKKIIPLYFFLLLFLSCSDESTIEKRSNENPILKPQVNLVTNPAMSNPDKFAWDLFIELSQPSSGNPKMTKWETWMLASEVFDNPNKPPIWEEEVNKNIDDFEMLPLQRFEHLGVDPKVMFDPNAPTRNETRMNKPAFDFIVKHDLYNIEGLEKVYAEYSNQKIDLPIESKEIKAIWREISVKDTLNHHYALSKDGRRYYGLKGLHIITKDIPNWFWSTFEHVDNLPESEEYQNNKALLKSIDRYGYDENDKMTTALKNDFIKGNLSDKWKYYRLRGTQTDFTDPMGKPTVLANSIIEKGFMRSSSCITCHALATVGEPTVGHSINRLDFFKNNGQGFIGPVDPGLFYKAYETLNTDSLLITGKPKYIQTDFMWSFMRAKRKN